MDSHKEEGKDSTKKEDAEIEWDDVIKFAVKNLDVFKKHEDDAVYWNNEGKGKHLEDDLKENIENWDDLSDEEKDEIIQAITGIMIFVSISSCSFGCIWCCCMCAGACMCFKDCQKDKAREKKIREATTKAQQRLQMAEQN